jgi:hypothetical protein
LDGDIKELAKVIKEVVSQETQSARYVASPKQKDLHIFIWPCRCWIKFKGTEPLPENAKLDDVWELAWAMRWDWMEEGSCSIEHGSDGRPFVSALSGRAPRAPRTDHYRPRVSTLVFPHAEPDELPLPHDGPMTKREARARHDAVVTRIIEARVREKTPEDEET